MMSFPPATQKRPLAVMPQTAKYKTEKQNMKYIRRDSKTTTGEKKRYPFLSRGHICLRRGHRIHDIPAPHDSIHKIKDMATVKEEEEETYV